MGGGMMGHGTDWLPPLLVLGIGLLAGAFLAWKLARGKRAAAATPAVRGDAVEIRDLRVQREQVLSQLRELDDTAGKRSPEELARDRYALELQAAAVLRDLDSAERAALAAAPAPAAPAAAQAVPRSSALVGALWGGGVVLFGAILFFVLQSNSGQRAAGGSVTGNGATVMGPGAGAPAMQQDDQPDPELLQAMARAEASPQDIEAQLDLAQALLYRDRLIDVFQVVQKVNAIQPETPRALTYEAVVRQAMGLPDMALQMLDKAVAKEPQLAEAWVRRGLVAFDLEKYDVAVQSWEKALELRPDGQQALAPVIAEAKLRAEGKGKVGKATMPGDEAAAPAPAPMVGMPAGHPAVAGAAPAEAGGAGALQLVIDLDPALKGKVAPGTPLFVSVRQAGVKAGPPAAARRLAAGDFPIKLAIGPGDTMMGQPLPEAAYVEARIDGDGNAMTRDPSDPTGSADGVKPGAETRIVLTAGN